MATINTQQINGVVNTQKSVWSNLEKLAEASGCWFTYDTHSGKYGWVQNIAGNSVASISEADILGAIQISGSSLTNLYNSIEAEFPNTEIRDQPHYVTQKLPSSYRNDYEPDNTLQISLEFTNNQPTAEYLSMVMLKQSRLDTTVTLVMDYTKIHLQAGDIIDITSETYGWTAREFRIMRVKEIEGSDGSLRVEFACSLYDDSIYSGTWNSFAVAGTTGIRSLTSISTPVTPVVTVATVKSLPTQQIQAVVPAGVVSHMQFWAGNVAATGNVANTEFRQIGSVSSTDAAAFITGQTATFTTATLDSGIWAWKARGINGVGTGAFSNVTANTTYTRNQAPDVILQGTQVVNSAGTTQSPIFGVSVRDFTPLDLIQYSGNSVYRPMISTGDIAMFGFNHTNPYIAASAPSGQSKMAFDVSVGVVPRKDYLRSFVSNVANVGVNTYVSVATWDETEYLANGFAGLNWSDWSSRVGVKDDEDRLAANSQITVSRAWNETPGTTVAKIYAIGTSTGIVPSISDFTSQVDPVSGLTSVSYVVPFSGNTVISNALGNAGSFQYPGLTGNITPFSMTAGGMGTLSVRIDK